MRARSIGFAVWLAVLGAGCGSDVDEAVGAACRDDRDCVDRCERGGNFPGGFCTLSCDTDRDCANGTICTDTSGGICLYGCGASEDCRFLGGGYACRERRDTFGDPVRVCLGG